MTVIKSVNISLNIISNYNKCIRVFKLLVYLGAKTHTAVLFGALYARDLLLLKGPSCLGAAAVYKVSVEFPFRSSRYFKGGWWV